MRVIIFSALLSLALLIAKDFTNSFGMIFKSIPSGSFNMGRDATFEDGDNDELPHHKVIIKSFYMLSTEVTQSQWVKIMGKNNPSTFKARNNPVENVSWYDVQDFISKLNQRESTTKYRLPSEAEWEYSIRAGGETKWSFGDEENKLKDYAWYSQNSETITHSVAQKRPNRFGLYDMHGNVWEWCEDWYSNSYTLTPMDEKPNTSGRKKYKTMRGGSWYDFSENLRSAKRQDNLPVHHSKDIGFRIVREK